MSTISGRSAATMCRIFAATSTGEVIDVPISGALTIGVGGSFGVGSQANVIGSGKVLTATNAGALRVFSDDGGVSIANSVRGIQSRLLLTFDQAGGTIRALQGQLKALTGIDVTTGIYTAVQGYVELAGTHISKTGATFSAIDSSTEIGTLLTINSGGEYYGVHVETTGAGTITQDSGGYCAAIGITKASGAASWPMGIYMPANSALTGIRIGNWVADGASGSAFTFAAAQDVYADRQLSVVAAFGESTSNLTAAYNAHVGRFRHIATGSSLTVAQETYGLIGQMCALGATMTHLHGGVMGTFEGTGALVVLNSSYTLGAHGAVIARVGGHTNITATTPLAGFLAFNNGTAAIASGTLSAFATSVRSTSYPWGYGLYIPSGSTTRPIYIAAAMAGSTHMRAVEFAIAEATTATSGYNASFIYEVTNTAAQSATEYSAGRFNLILDTGTKTGLYQAFKAKVGTNSAGTTTGAQISGLMVSMDEIGTVGYYRALWLEMYNTSSSTASSFVCCKSQGSAQQLTLLEHMGTNIPTYFMTTQTQSGGFRDSGATGGDQCIGHLKLLFGAQTAYINIYSDNS